MDLWSAEEAPDVDQAVDQAVEGAVDLLNVLLSVGLGVAGAIVVAFIVAVLFRLLERRKPMLAPVSARARSPLRATLVVLGVYIGVQLATRRTQPAWEAAVDHVLLIGIIACLTWLAAAVVYAVEDLALERNSGESNRARRVRTQMQILRRVVVAVIVLLGIAGGLLTFEGARAVGASLLASAGIISVVAGLAAQTSLANVFAGMQLAFSDAIRVDDIVVVEGEWGRIEEITLTYVVVHVWDDRRLILPSTYFTTTPFENWTRQAGQLLGTVDFDLDWSVPVTAMRHELDRILRTTELWDGRVGIFQIVDTIGGVVRVRALISGPDSPTLTDLKYHVRESLLLWLQQEAPYAFPRTHVVDEDRLTELPEHELTPIEEPAAAADVQAEVTDVPAPPRLDPETAARQEREQRRARRLARRRKDHAPKEERPEPALVRAERESTRDEATRLMTREELGLDEPRSTGSRVAAADRDVPAERETTAERSRFFTSAEGASRAEHFRGPGREALEERERTAERHRSGLLGDSGERAATDETTERSAASGDRPAPADPPPTDATTVLPPVTDADDDPHRPRPE